MLFVNCRTQSHKFH